MSNLWWLQPGWTETACANCGATIWPEGDPDWGLCFPCFNHDLQQREWDRQQQEAHDRDMERRIQEEEEAERRRDNGQFGVGA